jgi:hypothetical protein
MKVLQGLLSGLRSDKNRSPVLVRPSYLDRHKGCTALIVATGPSLKEYWGQVDELRRKYDAVTLGANHVTEFLYPAYHCFTNRKRYIEFAETIELNNSRVLLGPHLPKQLIEKHYCGPYETLMYVNDHDRRFDIKDGIIQASCRTVGVLLIGVAIVMGAERVLVAGMDGYKRLLREGSPIHHYGDDNSLTDEKQTEEEERLLSSERLNARFMAEIVEYLQAKGRKPFKIVTPTVYQDHYQPIKEFL